MAAPEVWSGILAAVTALSAALGLLLASRVLEGPGKRRRGFFCYYTNLSNGLILLYHTLLLIPQARSGFLGRSRVQLAVMLCILVTFLIYFCVLTRLGRVRGGLRERLGGTRLSNVLVHYVTPLLTAAEWLLLWNKTGLRWSDALWWLLVPTAYLLFTLLRVRAGRPIGETGRLWPYDFLDRERLGGKKWTRNLLLTAAGFWLLGVLAVGLAKLL